jgi:hypothetical protein
VGVGKHCNVFGSQELSNNEGCVSGRIVMVEKPIVVLPLVWTFAPNTLPQPLQNLAVKLAKELFRSNTELPSKTWNLKIYLLHHFHKINLYVFKCVYDRILVTTINLEKTAAVIPVIISVVIFQNHILFTRM